MQYESKYRLCNEMGDFHKAGFLEARLVYNDKQSLEIFSIHNSSAKGITT